MAAVWKHRQVGSIGPSHNQHNAARPTEDGEIRRPWAFLSLKLSRLVTVKGGYVPIVKTRNVVYGELLAWGFAFRDFLPSEAVFFVEGLHVGLGHRRLVEVRLLDHGSQEYMGLEFFRPMNTFA